MKIFPPHAADFYKTGHLRQYPVGTEYVYSNFTARSSKLAKMLPDFDGKPVFFGLQGVIEWLLIELWNKEFFDKPKSSVMAKYKRRMDTALGEGSVDTAHLAALHDLGYLPLHIKALPEGSRVNIRVPFFTVTNTNPEFYWLTNYLESQISAECWKSITNATVAFEYRRLLERYAELTGSPKEFVQWQGHDFSMRGMSGIHDASQSGAAHLLSFTGTDSISSIDYVEDYYGANADLEIVGGSVPATEHSVATMGGPEGELAFVEHLITELYPTGVVSSVADSYDFWWMMTKGVETLKEKILSRQPDALGMAKVVFRPDSGDPVAVVCGDPTEKPGSPAYKGAVECLWEVFGGTFTSTGHRLLNSKVGIIYGDSITLDRASRILEALNEKGFASANVVFGIGSFTYQHNTRDTFGHAYKATFGTVNGVDREIFKDPKTDSGLKRSAKGLLRVEQSADGDFVLFDQQTREQERGGLLTTVFYDGASGNSQTLAEIRGRLLSTLK